MNGMGTASVAGCGSWRTGVDEPDWAAARTFLDPLEALHFCRTDVPVNTNWLLIIITLLCK